MRTDSVSKSILSLSIIITFHRIANKEFLSTIIQEGVDERTQFHDLIDVTKQFKVLAILFSLYTKEKGIVIRKR